VLFDTPAMDKKTYVYSWNIYISDFNFTKRRKRDNQSKKFYSLFSDVCLYFEEI
jgi:hypothetical protein